MQRRDFLKSATAPYVMGSAARAAATRKRPNLLFIYTDDQRWDAIRALGRQTWLRTPNLDKLVAGGALFRNAFVTTSLCSPSRSSLLTGCYPHRTGIVNNERSCVLNPETPVVFPALKKAGYSTAYVGKVHVPGFLDQDRGLDFTASFAGQGRYFDNLFEVNGKKTPTKGYITDHINRYALEFLQNRDMRKPFAMYVGHKAVHSGFDPDPKYKDVFRNEWFGLPKTWDDKYEGRPSYLKARRKSNHGLDGVQERHHYSERERKIAACLISVDDGVGQILAHLRKTGELDNTLLIFSSDNGFFRGEHGLNDKRAAYEDSIRVPWVVHHPAAVKPGSSHEQMVLNIDLAPTLLDYAGVEAPGHMQGRSWKAIAEGREKSGRSSWMYEYHWEKVYPWDPTQYGIRTTRHKYVRYPDTGNADAEYPMRGELPAEELYDLQNDPLEMCNLAGEAAAGGVLREMRDLLRKALAETGYPGGYR